MGGWLADWLAGCSLLVACDDDYTDDEQQNFNVHAHDDNDNDDEDDNHESNIIIFP